jgi:hypothetical protein
LSKEKLKQIAPLLSINPAYIDSKDDYPFKSDSLIRIILPENVITMSIDFSLIKFLMDESRHVEFLLITPTRTFLEKKLTFEEAAYALAVRDEPQ